VGLDAEVRRKILCLCRGPNPNKYSFVDINQQIKFLIILPQAHNCSPEIHRWTINFCYYADDLQHHIPEVIKEITRDMCLLAVQCAFKRILRQQGREPIEGVHL
jgi:hypothetical protein